MINTKQIEKQQPKSSDSFIIEEFFKGQKDIFTSNKMYNQMLGKEKIDSYMKQYSDETSDFQDGMKSVKEDDTYQIEEVSNEMHENNSTERSSDCNQNKQKWSPGSSRKSGLYKYDSSIEQNGQEQIDGFNQCQQIQEINYQENQFYKHHINKGKEDDNQKVLQTFKSLLQKSSNNIDEFSKEEVIPFQQEDLSQIVPVKYEQNHVYNLENDNTEYILRNAEKYLDSPNDYQNNSDDSKIYNDKNQQILPNDSQGDFMQQFDDQYMKHQLLSQLVGQQNQIQNKEEINQKQNLQNNILNNEKNTFQQNLQDEQNSFQNTFQDSPTLQTSDSQITFKRCQNIEKIIEEYDRSIQNLSLVEEQPAILKNRQQSRSNSKQRDQEIKQEISPYKQNSYAQKQIPLENQYNKISSQYTSSNNKQVPVFGQNSITQTQNGISKPPKDNYRKENSYNQNESLDKEIKYQFQIALLESENNDFKQQIYQVQLEKEALQLKVERLESKTEALVKTITAFKEKLSLVSCLDSEIASNMEILSVENSELTQQNEQLQQNIKLLNNQNNALHLENKNFIESIKNMKSQIQYYQSKVDENIEAFNTQQALQQNQITEGIEQIQLKIEETRQSVSEYMSISQDLNEISKEVLKAYAPQKLQAKIDNKIKQIEKNKCSSQNQINDHLDHLYSQIKDICMSNINL